MGANQSSMALRVDLKGKSIKDIEKDLKHPHMLPAFSKLQELNLSKNKISIIPESINTDLDKAPAVIENLTVLNLAKNKFTEFPAILFRLHNLKNLNMSHNEIVIIPDKLLVFYCIEELDLSHNQIKRLPWAMHRLTALKVLKVDNNAITHFPNNLGKMRNLLTFSFLPNPVDESYDNVKGMDQLLAKISKQKMYRDDALADFEKDREKNEALSPDEQIVRKLLKYTEGLEALTAFTKKELSYENLDFYKSVRDFRHKYHSVVEIKSEKLIEDAKVIYEKFIKEDAPSQVNLPAHALDKCKKAFTDTFNYPKGINQWIFNPAYKASFDLMVKDTFLRFKLTADGKELIELLQRVESKRRPTD